VCNNCSARVNKDDTFCQACGNRLKEEKKEENTSNKICKECGLTLDGSASFCPGCGCKLTQRRRKRKKKMVKETSEN
jgi:rRNA maturation endonuclease Nob1